MHFQYFHTAFQIRSVHDNPAVETSRTEKRRVENFRTVGSRQDQKSLGSIESVHLRKELVQRLFSLVIPSVMGITALADSVDLVDKNNTWSVFLGLFKKVPDTGRAHAHEHLHKF